MEEFKEGDVIKKKRGRTKMTLDKMLPDNKAECVYFNKNKRFFRKIFDTDELLKIE